MGQLLWAVLGVMLRRDGWVDAGLPCWASDAA